MVRDNDTDCQLEKINTIRQMCLSVKMSIAVNQFRRIQANSNLDGAKWEKQRRIYLLK